MWKLSLVAIALAVLPARAQDAPTPKFEVVSIKPCEYQQRRGEIYPPRGNSSPGRLSTGCFPLLDVNGMGLIRAYAASPFTPINGGPSWIRTAFYEINARAEGTPAVATMMGPMMQTLLEDRFHLRIHRQTTERPVYLLSVARGGAKLQKFIEGTCTPYSTEPPPPLQPGTEYCATNIRGLTPASVETHGATLDEFSRVLRAVLDRPVIDKTQLAGRFNMRIEFSLEGTRLEGRRPDGSSLASDPTGSPSIFTAIQEQLGLRLEPGRGPVETFVIDSIEKPSGN